MTKHSLKHVLVAVAAMLCATGCYPALRTVQPTAKVVVHDPAGRALENATFTLATYRYPFPSPRSTQLARFQTDSAGAVSIPWRGIVQMEVLLPDGSACYQWGYCIEKAGYGAVAVAEAKFDEPLSVVLQPHPAASRCQWPGAEDDSYWGVKVVE
jgi:hypothetical protein